MPARSQAVSVPKVSGGPIVRLTHADRKIRRQRIAAAIRAGKSPSAVANSFGVGLATVRDACREYRVKWPAKPGRPRRMAKQV